MRKEAEKYFNILYVEAMDLMNDYEQTDDKADNILRSAEVASQVNIRMRVLVGIAKMEDDSNDLEEDLKKLDVVLKQFIDEKTLGGS